MSPRPHLKSEEPNIAVPLGSTQSRLIDIGRVAQNYIGADLLHFRKHYGADEQLWSALIARYAEVFEVDTAEVRAGAIAYAVQREIENQLRLRERGIAIKTGRLSGLLSELPLRLPRLMAANHYEDEAPSQPSVA